MLRRRDLLWVLAFPIYQLIGTLRHEGSHALVALLSGARIREFVFWPSIRPQRGFLWGYVLWEGRVSGLVMAAPYLCDLLTYALFFGVCMAVPVRRRWVWLNLVIVGLLSPLVNSLYNCAGSFWRRNDVAQLWPVLPAWAVRLCFALAIALYGLGLWAVFRRSRAVVFRQAARP